MIASIDLTTSALISVVCDKRLLGERPDRPFDRLLGLVGLGLEFLLQQRIEVARLDGADRRCCVLLRLWVCHKLFSGRGSAVQDDGSSAGFFVLASVFSSAGSCSSLATRSSAPLLPSM